MNISRRDILKFAGGSALGLILSPVPYKLLDDSSIWTQTWGPKPPRGETSVRYLACTLCPAGCGLRARCVGSQPVGMMGVAEHPLSRGAACPVGLSGHHLAYHPARVMQPVRLSRRNGMLTQSPVPFLEAIAAVSRAINRGGTVGILDAQPGRAISAIYKKYMAGLPHGVYIAEHGASTFSVLRNMIGKDRSFGYDIENTKTVLSFGAPLFEGWGTPGRLMERVRKDTLPVVIQAETRMSNSAVMADRWLPLKPGSEGALALGLAHVLMEEEMYDTKSVRRSTDFRQFAGLVREFTPAFVARLTGLQAEAITRTAMTMARGRPTIAIGGGNPGGGPLDNETEQAIWALNVLLGSVGTPGGVLMRQPVDEPMLPESALRSLPDHSLNVLIVDGAESGTAIPWQAVQSKLVTDDSLVLSLSPYAVGMTKHADIVIPSPAFLEMSQDAPTMFDVPFETFSVTSALYKTPNGVTTPLETISAIASATGGLHVNEVRSNDDLLKRKARHIHELGRGRLVSLEDGKEFAVGSSDDFWAKLQGGSVWMDMPGSTFTLPTFSFIRDESAMRGLRTLHTPELVIMPYGWQAISGNAAVSPVLSKLYQESDLFSSGNSALINPATARARAFDDGASIRLMTQGGELPVRIRHDEAVMPGVIHVAVGPVREYGNVGRQMSDNVLAVCVVQPDGLWRVTPVSET